MKIYYKCPGFSEPGCASWIRIWPFGWIRVWPWKLNCCWGWYLSHHRMRYNLANTKLRYDLSGNYIDDPAQWLKGKVKEHEANKS